MTLIVSWNVNSVKSRLQHLCAFIAEVNPDILLLQETKCEAEKFPRMELEDLGYNIVVKGQKSYNGVAILSKSPIEDVFTDLIPVEENNSDARYIEAFTSVNGIGIRVASVYVPQGTNMGSDRFLFKLRFYNYLRARYKELIIADELFLAGGDYNVGPEEIDVYNPKGMDGSLGFHIDERKGFRAIVNTGMRDSFRMLNPSVHEYSWWDYRSGGWQHNKGMRIDQILASPLAVDRLQTAGIYSHVRGWEKASDHTPIYCKLSAK